MAGSRVVVVLGALVSGAAGCGALVGVDFDSAHLAPEAGTSGPSDGGTFDPQNPDGGALDVTPGTVLDGGSTSACTPDPSTLTCAGVCGATKDNCGDDRACSTDCGSGQACNGGKCQCVVNGDWCHNRCGTTKDNCGNPIDCGMCPGTDTCTNNACGCIPDSIATTCGSKQCGTAVNNCNQTVNCGNNGQCATAGAICKADGSCCSVAGNACAGRCGGVTVKNSCGQDVGCPASCNSGQVCVGSSCCTPEPLATTCAGVTCGPKTNNCGQTVNCPDNCVAPQTCGGGGAGPNACGCTPNPDPCGDRCSGTMPDGCGGTVTCHASCAVSGDICTCRGGNCSASTHFCVCATGPCL